MHLSEVIAVKDTPHCIALASYDIAPIQLILNVDEVKTGGQNSVNQRMLPSISAGSQKASDQDWTLLVATVDFTLVTLGELQEQYCEHCSNMTRHI